MKPSELMICFLKEIVEKRHLMTVTQVKDGHEIYKWPTQAFHNNSCELSYTSMDLYDGFLGNLIVEYFYSKYFCNGDMKVYHDYLSFFQYVLADNGTRLDGNVGAYGDLGGGLFVLNAIYKDSGCHKLLPIIAQLVEHISSAVSKVESADYIYGLTGLPDRLTCSKQWLGESVTPLIDICTGYLIKQQDVSRYGFAHGSFSLISVLEKHNFINNYSSLPLSELLQKIRAMDRRKSSWQFSWCNGELGELYTLITLFKKNGNKHILDFVVQRFYLIYAEIMSGKCVNYSLCHGSLGALDLAYELYTLSTIPEKEYAELVDRVLLNPDLKQDYQYSSNGVMVGQLGSAYQILRFLLPEKVPSILML